MLDQKVVTALAYLDMANEETSRLYGLHLPNGPSTTDMAMATLLYRAAEMNLRMADAIRSNHERMMCDA